MQETLDVVTEALRDSTAVIAADYFALPVSGQEDPQYRERVYCYELYHQWRSLWNHARFKLCGEIDKAGHPIIRNNAKPDFLVHVPGAMENLLAVEVKPANAALRDVVKDLKTLTFFRQQLGGGDNYFAAYLLIYGMSLDQWTRFAMRVVERVALEPTVDLQVVRPLVHTQVGTKAVVVAWPEPPTA